jgi:four helix bundle protein
MEVFRLTRAFPKEELYGLTGQLRSASRSAPANIAQGWAKRRHEAIFKRKLLDAIGSANEVLVWLDMARECGYLPLESHGPLYEAYQSLGRRLNQLLENWKTYK